MKKILIVLISVVMVLNLASCGSSNNVSVENGAFTISPQQLIDKLNDVAKKSNGKIYHIPKYDHSGIPIEVGGSAEITIYANDSNNVTRIKFSWGNSDVTNDQIMSMGFYFASTIGILDPSIQTDISDELEVFGFHSSGIKTEYWENDIYFYMIMLNGRTNIFIQPKKDEELESSGSDKLTTSSLENQDINKIEENITKSEAELDDEKSKELSEMMEGSFGGAGNPEFATSWYKYIENLEIYSGDSGYYAVVTVSTDATDEATDRIAHSVLANFDNPKLVKTVVNDTNGNQIKEISK